MEPSSCGMWTLVWKRLLCSGKLDDFVFVTELISRHIEGVWGVDIDALRIASASHGMSDPETSKSITDPVDRTVKVWDRESGNCVQTLVGHRGAVTSLQLSDDMIVSGSGE